MEIDDYSIIMGWFWLKVVERAGFVVDFALDHVKSIAAVAFLYEITNVRSRTSLFMSFIRRLRSILKRSREER